MSYSVHVSTTAGCLQGAIQIKQAAVLHNISKLQQSLKSVQLKQPTNLPSLMPMCATIKH